MDFSKSTEFGGKLRNSEAIRTLAGLIRQITSKLSSVEKKKAAKKAARQFQEQKIEIEMVGLLALTNGEQVTLGIG